MTRALLILVALGACTDPGTVDSDGDELDPINLGWIGGACGSADDCHYPGSSCLAETSGFPGGLCTLACERTCPDLEGPDHTETFCVASTEGRGTCASRCDFELLPETGCRAGYGCVGVSRMGEPDTVVDSCMPLGTDGRARPLNDLQPALERAAIASNLEDERIVLIDVTEGRPPLVAAMRASEPVYPASVIKTVVMVELERQIEAGLLARDTQLVVTPEQDTCESLPSGDTRPTLEAGDSASIDELEAVMISRSDNTATNVLIDHVGRLNITAFMDQLGLSTLQVYRKVFGCEPYTDSGWDGIHVNTMTALDTARLYHRILDGGSGFVGGPGRQRMQAVLADQRWRGGFSAGLPDDAVYMSKTGNTSEVVHDSGIILWRGRRYVLAAFTELEPSTGRPRLQDLGVEIGKIMALR